MTESPETYDIPEIPAWRRYLAYLTVAVMPLSMNVEKLVHSKDKRFLSPLDFLIVPLIGIVLWDLIRLLQRVRSGSGAVARPSHPFAWPPALGMVWAILALASCQWIANFPAGETMHTWFRGIQGSILFGVLAVWVFQNLAPTPTEFRRMSLVLGLSVGVCLLLALRQYVGPVGLPFDPANKEQDLQGVTNIRLAGWYDFRGNLGALVAMIAPAAVAFAVLDRDSAVRSAAFLLAALSLFVTLSAGGFIGAIAGIVAIMGALAALRRWRAVTLMGAFLTVMIVVLLPRLPRHNPQEIADGVALYVGEPGKKEPGARLRRYQAELDLLSARTNPYDDASSQFWTRGVGSGQYQSRLGPFYTAPYDKPNAETDNEAAFGLSAHEPYTFGLLETVTIELGVCGLVTVLLLFAVWIASASGAVARLATAFDGSPAKATRIECATLALAAMGAGVGGLVFSIFGNPAVRGPGSVFAFFFALALCSRRWSTQRDLMREFSKP